MLPEKWYIIRTEQNHKELNKWENDKYGEDDAYLSGKAYFFSDTRYKSNGKYIEGYTEITFEQFKREILNELITYEIY